MKILLIDDLRSEDIIEITYGKRPTHVARDYDQGIKALKEEGPFDLLYLDHDLGDYNKFVERTGYDVMCFLEENPQFLPKEIVFVTANPVGRKKMMAVYRKLYS